jgi:drug/metabolite transporter (DMT)-like permease
MSEGGRATSKAVALAVVASFCTATSSVCQRKGASTAPTGDRFTPKLLLHLVRQPIWIAGVASMILGFVFQVVALHFGSLALVQPIFASELLFVFTYMALIDSRKLVNKDWMAAVAMAAGLSVFLFTAAPSGGRLHPPASSWWLAGISTLGLVALLTGTAYLPVGRHSHPSPARRAAIVGVATGVSWGFVAAVIKELSTHKTVVSTLSSWTPYVLIGVGALSMLLASHALQAGPLPASQPGFTIVDPLVASLLGVFLFSEHLQLGPWDLLVEALSLAALVWGVITLSHSRLVHGEEREPAAVEGLVNVGLSMDV